MRFRRCEMDVFGMNKLLVRLQFMLQSLPRAEKAVAEYMAAHVAQMSDMTLSMLSDETSVSEATILRFCRQAWVFLLHPAASGLCLCRQ